MRNLYLFLCFFISVLFFFSPKLNAQVVINELMASNATNITDPDFGNYADWIELYNTGNTTVNLSGWSLTDNASDSLKWFFPSGTVLPSSGYLLIWADGENTGLHTGYKLGSAGEEVALFNSTGQQQDATLFGEQTTDISFGRKTDGSSPWGYFTKPTPGVSNGTSTFYEDFVQQVPVFSVNGGFFQSSLAVEIQNLNNIGTLRYTTNGADPSSDSPVYAQSLQLSATTVVKARIFYPNRIPGPVATNTYFINENFDQRGLPVMSLSTHPDYFYAADSGLYVQDYKPTWEYPVHMEFYEPDGVLGFHHDAGVQVGGENAWILPQKLLNIYSRKQYGNTHFDYQLFPGNPRKQFGDIVLRCSGSDWSYTLFRDGMMQSLIQQQADLDVQDFRPCIVYINGQYIGIQNIREKQDQDYTEYYQGIDPDSLDYIENNAEIKEGDDMAYQQMVAMLTNGVAGDAAFQNLSAVVDTRNFSDYIISQIFTANTSWGHNIALFKGKSNTSKWRWLLHDYDRGFDPNNVGTTAMAWATSTTGQDWTNPAWGTLFLRKMLENNTFKQQFITRFADHLYVTFNPVAVNKLVDKHANWIRKEIPNHVNRWTGTTSSYGNGIPTVAFWENEVNDLKIFGVQRNAFMWNDLESFFGLAETTTLNLTVSDLSHGFIRLHDIKVPSYPWTGKYFQNRSFTLTAAARPGFNFVRWEKLSTQQTTLIGAGSTWKYRDASTAPPTDWNTTAFNDQSWTSGPAQLGYGEGDENTVLDFGSDANNKIPAYYFRQKFTVADPANTSGLIARMLVDDGAVVYLNGQEVWRFNMSSTPVIQFTDFALSSASEGVWNELNLPATALVAGDNVLTVEVHQASANSSDISFDFELKASSGGSGTVLGINPVIDVTLDAELWTIKAVFESDGSCGILPDTIFQNITLTAACSPYRAAGDVVVKPNAALTVEAGVEIQFPDHANLWVHGQMEVNGTESAPVVIKNKAGSTTWGGMFFKDATAPSNLNYLRLENATAGVHRYYYPAAISAYRSGLTMDHLDLTHVNDNPVFARFSDVTLTNSKVRSVVTGDGINVKQGHARIENCTFEGGFQADMDAIDYDGVIDGIVRNNTIHDFRGDNCDGLDIGEKCRNLVIEGNFIYHCFDKGISVGQQSSATIRDNTIAYTAIGIALKDQSQVQIDHCTLFGNQSGVAAYEKNPGYLGGSGVVTDCIVSNAASSAYIADGFSLITLNNCLSDLDSISYPGSINDDPKFVNPTWFNFHLETGSPAISTGSNGSNLGAVTLPVYAGNPEILISEILYHDTLTTTGEFLELYNPGNNPVDLEGYSLRSAIDFVFPAGAVIAPGGYVVVAKSAANFTGATYPVYEWLTGKLRDEGEVIHLFDANGLLVDFVRYDNHVPWPVGNTLLGRSIESDPVLPDNHFGYHWSASLNTGGTPGTAVAVSTHDVAAAFTWEVSVYPNPAMEMLHIAFKGVLSEGLSLFLTDFSGKTIARQSIPSGSGLQIFSIPVKGYAPGNYALSVVGSNNHLYQTLPVVVVR